MDDPWQNESLVSAQTDSNDIQSQFTRGCLANDVSLISTILSDPTKKASVNLNQPDESGSPALLIASCFGYAEIVKLLIAAGANVDAHDSRGWSALMWASNNNHTSIAKLLIDQGADREAVTKKGRSASHFATDDSLKESLSRETSGIGAAGMSDLGSSGQPGTAGADWYGASSGLDFEETLREQEQARRMALEAGMNLEVDLGALSMEPAEAAGQDNINEDDDEPSFVWDRCLPSQMFVFSEASIPDIVRLTVLEYPPQRNPSQRPVPANLLFLSSRFAQYYSTPKILTKLLEDSLAAIERTVNTRHDDMTMLSFWISNCLLLQYYLRKDPGLTLSSGDAQLHLSELINETYVLLIHDAERRIDKVLDESILEYSAIEGLSAIEMSDEWRIFRKKQAASTDRDLSPRRRRGASPRNITSLLSSTLYVLEAYSLHPIIIIQALAQVIFWLSSELFNRILHNKKYLSRGKAMDLRMNVSQIEEWIRSNNRAWQDQPDLETRCKEGMKRLVGLLQLLQCISSLREDEVRAVVDGIEGISPRQALFVAEHYRSERTENRITRATKVSLAALEREQSSLVPADSDGISLDADEQLAFSLPTTTDLILSYGAGIGGTQRENERLFTPTLPLDLIERLDGGAGPMASLDRARGYTAGMATGLGHDGHGDDVGEEGDFETLRRREEEQRLANLVGVHSGVW